MQHDEQRLVTQAEFFELTNMEPVDIYILIQDGKLPTVKKNGAHLIDLDNPRAKCWLPESKKELFYMGSHWLIHSSQSSMRFVPPYPERILGVG